MVAQPFDLYLFPLGVKVLEFIKSSCAYLHDVVKIIYVYLRVESSSAEICNSYLSMYVILNMKVLWIAFHSSRSVWPCEPTIC